MVKPSAGLIRQLAAGTGASVRRAALFAAAVTVVVAPASTQASSPIALQIMGGDAAPGFRVVLPRSWHTVGGTFAVRYAPTKPGPLLALSVWDVGVVFRNPCHWKGQGYNPGPTVADLVRALAAQQLRAATKPTDVTLAGYTGRYLELSVPANMKSSRWTSFDACDMDTSGYRDFQGWLGKTFGNRHEAAPGQVDRLWILNVKGRRLVVDATYTRDTNQRDRHELEQLVKSLQFVTR